MLVDQSFFRKKLYSSEVSIKSWSDDGYYYKEIKEFLVNEKKFSNFNIKVIGKSRTEKNEILVLSQNFGLKKFIYNYLYIFF